MALLCAGLVTACEQQPEKADATAGAASAGVAQAVEKAADDAVEKAGGERLFDPADKELRKRACELLTVDMVAKQFGVPAAELDQRKMMGCMYTWRKDGQLVDAKLMMIRIHKTTEGAATWFDNATATKTRAQLDAEMDLVKKKVQEREELDTDMKKKTAGQLTDIAKMASPAEGVRYDDVPGIADAARVSNADGVVWVRLGNVTFQVTGYKGPDQPKPKFDPKDLKGIAKAAMDAQRAWVAETLAERKEGAKKLAPLVVEALSAARAR